MRSLILCAAVAICTCNAQYVDYLNAFSNSDCIKSGSYCLNSTVRINCEGDGDGGFINLGEYDCSKEMNKCCEGLCQDPKTPCTGGDNSDLKFQCSETGTFPDFEECKKYHVCNGTTLLYSAECACQPYDLMMGMCSTSSPPCMDCPKPSIDCTDESEHGNFQPYPPKTMKNDNPSSFFYICINSSAYTLGKCPDEETIIDDKGCKPVCDGKHKGPFTDQRNCHNFHFCDNKKMLQSAMCPIGEGYSDSNKSCIPLPSEILPKCESNGTPSTSHSTTTTPDSTSSSTKPSTPTTSTTSTTGKPKCPFQCEIPGNYSDSTNCHKYFSCSSNLMATCYDCGSEVFSPFYRQCVIGIC